MCKSCINQLVGNKCPIDNQPIEKKIPNFALIPGFNSKRIQNFDVARKTRSNRTHFHDPYESYEKVLLEILESDSIICKIESNFGKIGSQSKFFIRVLVIAVCKNYLDLKKSKADSIRFKTLANILSIFIKTNKEFELESLFAIQELEKRIQIYPGILLNVDLHLK